MRLPGSKTKLLEQKIPATYLALEDVVGGIASELRAGGNDPVLNQVQEIAWMSFLLMIFHTIYGIKSNNVFFISLGAIRDGCKS